MGSFGVYAAKISARLMSSNEIYSRESLLEAIQAGRKFEYIFFWGHRPTEDGSISASCCSQWFEAGFDVDGQFYPTAEHFMMAQKARLFADREMLGKILASKTPNEAKAFGRKVRGFKEDIWNENCFEFVVKGNIEKFSQNPRLLHWLQGTRGKILVEASPTDAIWGIGMHRDDASCRNPSKWNGTNLLGFALMKVRDQLFNKS